MALYVDKNTEWYTAGVYPAVQDSERATGDYSVWLEDAGTHEW